MLRIVSPRLLPIGLAAGLASALLFASVVSGSMLSVLLFYAAPLPIMIAALGWSHLAGLVASVVGTLVLAVALSPTTGLIFAIAVALPAWVLAYLALLGRSEEGQVTDWYPIGTLTAIAALVGVALGMVAVLALGTDYDSYRAALVSAIETVLRAQAGIPEGQPLVLPEIGDATRLVSVLQVILPPAVVAVWVLTTLLDLWISARIVRTSGRMVRPWPDLSRLRLPRWSSLATLAALLLAFLPGLPGLVGELALAALGVAFMLQGFAVVHAVTRGQRARPFLLSGLYLACFLLSWLTVGLALLGIADQLLDIRGRINRGPANDNRLT